MRLAHPDVSELRVLFGMALCVDFKVQDAIEELREGVRLAPDSFIAQLKMGELWMRLRVIEKAEEHTHQAALLAAQHGAVGTGAQAGGDDSDHDAQRNRARRSSYKGPWHLVTRSSQALEATTAAETLARRRRLKRPGAMQLAYAKAVRSCSAIGGNAKSSIFSISVSLIRRAILGTASGHDSG